MQMQEEERRSSKIRLTWASISAWRCWHSFSSSDQSTSSSALRWDGDYRHYYYIGDCGDSLSAYDYCTRTTATQGQDDEAQGKDRSPSATNMTMESTTTRRKERNTDDRLPTPKRGGFFALEPQVDDVCGRDGDPIPSSRVHSS